MKMTFRTIVVGGLIVFFAVVTVVVFIPNLLWNPPQTIAGRIHYDAAAGARAQALPVQWLQLLPHPVRPRRGHGHGRRGPGRRLRLRQPHDPGLRAHRPRPIARWAASAARHGRSSTWKDPRSLSPLSIMPSFDFLSDDELKAMAAYVFSLGDRVAQIADDPAALGHMRARSTRTRCPLPPPCPAAQAQGWPTWKAAGLQEGKEIYIEHLSDLPRLRRQRPGHLWRHAGRDAGQLQAGSLPGHARRPVVLARVRGTVRARVMPTWKLSLSEDQRWKVIAYVQQTFAQPLMHDPDEGDAPAATPGWTTRAALGGSVERGKPIYSGNAWSATAVAGRGDGPYGAGLEPLPPDFTDNSPVATTARWPSPSWTMPTSSGASARACPGAPCRSGSSSTPKRTSGRWCITCASI